MSQPVEITASVFSIDVAEITNVVYIEFEIERIAEYEI